MSDKPSQKKERKRSSSSSSYSSTSSESSSDAKTKNVDKTKESRPANSVGNLNKVSLDIGYKIQQEELSDSDDSDGSSTPPRVCSQSNDVLKYSGGRDKKRERSKSQERKYYRSPSHDKKKEKSPSKDSKKDRSQIKVIKPDFDFKSNSKYEQSKSRDRKERSRSKERKKERSRSRDRRKRLSKSKERKLARSSSRDRKKEKSRSRERRRDRSKSKDRAKDKRRERSRSKEKRRERSKRESRSPSYYKDSKSYIHSKRGKSRERSGKRSRSRSRSRSRPSKRSRSRSRSFDRPKRSYDKKFNKLSILEKLGIELKVPEGQVPGETGGNASGFSIPSYYNPAGVNPLKYAQQMQKRRLIWGSKKQEGEASTEKKEEVKETKIEEKGPESVWKGTTFLQDQDGKLTAKFKRLMGIKNSAGEEEGSSQKNSELIQKQEEMFTSMEKQYEVARVSTHTHRGLGLGFGVHLPR